MSHRYASAAHTHHQWCSLIAQRAGHLRWIGVARQDEMAERVFIVPPLKIGDTHEELALVLPVVGRQPFKIHFVESCCDLHQVCLPNIPWAVYEDLGWCTSLELATDHIEILG